MQNLTLYAFLKPYRHYIIAALSALICTALITLTFGQGLRILVDQGLASGNLQLLNEKIFFFITIIVLLGIGTYARYYFVSILGEKIGADLRREVFNHILFLPTQFFETNPVGDLHSRIISDITILQQVIGGSLSVALRNFILLLGGLVLLLSSNTQLTLTAFLLMPIVLLPILFYGRRVKRLSRENQDKVAHLGAYLSESLQQIKTLQAFNHQPYDSKLFANYIDNVFSVSRERIKQRALLIAFVIILVLCAVVLLLWLGGRSVLEGTLSPGELVAFLFYAVLVAGSAGALSEVWTDLLRAQGAVERLFELLATPIQKFSLNPITNRILQQSQDTETSHFVSNNKKQAKLEITNLTFCYPSRPEIRALQNLNIQLESGSHLALVGKSGAGKSTIFELLLGFYSVPKNSIFIDHNDIHNLTNEELRNQIAWVSQQPAIFSGTIHENIAYGNPSASTNDIIAAATAAHAIEFIQHLPKGFQSEVGEHGMQLSGGQRQRIALARAFLCKPRLLLLDEPTSALDAHSEQMIQLALKEIMQNCTTIIIAHRLATVKAIENIAVMDKGRIIALGSHNDLMDSCELYADLARLQMIN